jgi:RNA polymerase sigma factor (sigma-70 family)
VLDDRTDAELLRRTASDGDAFGVFYRRHAVGLLDWLEREARDRQVALELTAEAFAQALRVAHRFADPGDGNARPWLFGIARNLLRMYLRSARIETAARRRLGIFEETSRFSHEQSDGIDRMDAARTGAGLQRALGALPEAQRRAVELRVIDELSYGEIAARLDCTDAAARLRVSRGLARLRTRLPGGAA